VSLAADLVAELTARNLSVAVAESLTGGLLVAELVAVPGASLVVRGGVVAYATDLKRSLLGVSAELLAAEGPVHPEVARQMAVGVRRMLSIDGIPAAIGLATTGVAGPGAQDGHPAGEVYVAIAIGDRVEVFHLHIPGSREDIRKAVVSESLRELAKLLHGG
jgi:nicotinamide-nucleotide amidase